MTTYAYDASGEPSLTKTTAPSGRVLSETIYEKVSTGGAERQTNDFLTGTVTNFEYNPVEYPDPSHHKEQFGSSAVHHAL